MAKKERRPICMVKRGTHLVPDMQMDADALEGIAQGERVRVEIGQWRSTPRLRAYWAMLNEVVKATDCAPSAEKLHEVIKLETGHVDLVRVGKMTVAIPGSIAFDKISEAEMVKFFREAEMFLARHYGWSGEDVAA